MYDITLINPGSPFLTDPMVMPPLGILYVISSLKEQGYNVNFLDLAKESNSACLFFKENELKKSKSFGITATTAQYLDVWSIKHYLKSMFPDIPIVIGGAHATVASEECLNDGFDAVIVGEGEYATADFLNGQRGIIPAKIIQDLDKCPFPDRTLVLDYHYAIDNLPTTTMMTSRGCPYNCAFCCKNWGSLIRYRSTKNVISETKKIAELGYYGIMFYDDEMLINWERDKEIFKNLNDLIFVWRCFTRSDILLKNEERIKFIEKNGCREILLGIESGSNAILKNVNKGTTVDINKEAIKKLYDHNIRVKASMIIGLPGESINTLIETLDFCKDVEEYVSDWDFSVLIPYPGSDIYNHPEKYDIIFDKFDIYNPFKMGKDWKAVVSTWSLNKDEITGWRNMFHQRFKK